MSVLGSAGKGAAAGAVIGSAVPGIGTVAGAVGGAIIGGVGSALSGGKGPVTSGGDASNGPRSNFTYGNTGPLSAAANQAAGAAQQQGAGYASQAQGLANSANGSYTGAYDAQGRAAPQLAANDADRRRQLAALGGTNAAAGQVMNSATNVQGAAGQVGGVAGQLQQMGSQQMGTGIAASQLAQGQDAANRAALSMAGSGRSIGGGAAAMQQAQMQGAQGNQIANQQAATANLQEQQQNQNFQLNALGAAQQGYGAAGGLQGQAGGLQTQAGGLYGQAGQQATGLRQGDEGINAQNAALQQGQQQVNNQTTTAYGQLGASQQTAALGQEQAGLGQQQLANQILTTQLGAGEQYQASINGTSIAQQGLNNQQTGMALGAATGAANAYAQYEGSDRDAKQDIKPANGEHESWLSHMLWHGGLGGHDYGKGGDSGKASGPPALVRNPNNPSQMISPYASIGAASHGAMGAQANAQAAGRASQAAYAAGPDQRAQESLAALGGYAPATADTWGDAPPPVEAPKPGDPGGPPAPWLTDYMQGQNAQSMPPGYVPSDEHSKTRIAELEGQLAALGGAPNRNFRDAATNANALGYDGVRPSPRGWVPARDVPWGGDEANRQPAYPASRAPDTAALDAAYRREGGEPSIDLRPAQGYSYEYKEPERFGHGRFWGPMAQDLEKTPPGASTVKRSPDGTKMVDTSRLSLVNTAAISELQRKQDSMLAALGGRSPYPMPSAPDNRIDLDRGMRQGGAY